MTAPSGGEISQLLQAWSDGDEAALEKLAPLVYAELHRLARHYLGREGGRQSIQATELVNEAYLRLVDCKDVRWHNRAHFFALSARMMRRILVDFARTRGRAKRWGDLERVSLDQAAGLTLEPPADLVALDEALDRLAALDPRKEQVVELRFFGGLTVDETAEALKVSAETVTREWSLARAWLLRTLCPDKKHVSDVREQINRSF
jgi:RNA polymerase sigma-70 factor, ECF subfamily